MNKVYHPYWLWEELKTNMWGEVENREEYLQKAIRFTSRYKIYGRYMLKVVKLWKYSCEENLTNISQNRQAWIGHAACALAFNCPEDIVREAWWQLTDEQRKLANIEADNAIKFFEQKHLSNYQHSFL